MRAARRWQLPGAHQTLFMTALRKLTANVLCCVWLRFQVPMSDTSVNPPEREPQKKPRSARRRPLIAALCWAVFALLLVAALAWGEAAGWPFLAAPLERQLSNVVQREVRFSDPAWSPSISAASAASAASASSNHHAPATEKIGAAFSVRFLGGLRLRAPALWVAAAPWSQARHVFSAHDVALDLRYADVWRAYRGQPMRIERLQASRVDVQLERLADGRASWQFRPRAVPVSADAPWVLPTFGVLNIGSGTLRLNDAPLELKLQCELTWTPQQLIGNGAPKLLTAPAALIVQAQGQYKKFPLIAELKTAASVPELSDTPRDTPRLPLLLRASVGRAKLSFDGSSASAFSLSGLAGRFDLSGPSLAAVGDPVGVTLPTTGAFRSQGRIVKQGGAWRVVVDDAVVGSSRLSGAFTYQTAGGVHQLSGRLGGSRLLMSDLGPAIGGTARAAEGSKPVARPITKVLPSRPFDLKALRAMDANVLIDIREVDLNTHLLQPLRPLRAHLQLVAGVLTLSDLEARTAQGELRGLVRLDGRKTPALWNATLRWNDVRLERWIQQVRANAAPPWVSGRLYGSALLQGQGRSTAEILATLQGKVRTELKGGAVSHLAVEAAGLDVAQGLGMLFKGDDALPVQCGVADLVVDAGNFKPRLMVLDTKDSAVWVDGSLSLASETLDLRAVVMPKDFSPLALRTPLHVKGSFAKPEVSLEKAPLARKLGLSVLLGLLNPLAALIPLIDPGDAQAAAAGGAAPRADGGSGCAHLALRARAASQARRP
jgi:AsmA family protein